MKTVQYISLISSTSHVVKEDNSSSLTKTGISERNSTLKKEITNKLLFQLLLLKLKIH